MLAAYKLPIAIKRVKFYATMEMVISTPGDFYSHTDNCIGVFYHKIT